MRWRIPIALVLAAFVAVSCDEQPPTAATDDAVAATTPTFARQQNVIATVYDIWDQYTSYAESADVDAWISLWTDDAVQMPPDRQAVVGKEAIRAGFAFGSTLFLRKDFVITTAEVRRAGDLAFARGTYTLTLTPKAGGSDISVDGKFMTIFEKQQGGSWKIHRDIFNSNVP